MDIWNCLRSLWVSLTSKPKLLKIVAAVIVLVVAIGIFYINNFGLSMLIKPSLSRQLSISDIDHEPQQQAQRGQRFTSLSSSPSASNANQYTVNAINDAGKHISKPGISYDRMTQQLIGPPEPSPVQAYDTLFPHPTSIFPRGTVRNESAESLQEQLATIRKTLTTKNILLQKIALEMDVMINGDGSRIAYLMSLISDASHTLKYVFIGSQSVGKSHTLNAITSLSLSAMNISIGTKSPVYGKMRAVPKGQELFSIDGVAMQFEDLLPELKRKFEHQSSISDREVELEIRAPFIAYPIDFVDLPGYVVTKPTEADMVIQMIRKYAKDPYVHFVMISDASRDPDTEADNVLNTLRDLVDDSRIIFIINKVNLLMKEGHSPSEFVTRIKHIIDYLRCSDENLPYLFTVPKNKSLDERSQRISPERQVELWEHAVADGEKLIHELVDFYAPYWKSYFKYSYPIDRFGIKAWKVNTAKSLIDNFRDRFNTFFEEEERQAPMTEAMGRIEVPQWIRIMEDFNYELITLLERVAQNSDGIWERIIELGGGELIEDAQTRRERTNQCVNNIMSQQELQSKKFVESKIRGRELINPIEYMNRSSERGNTLLLAEIYDLYQWMLFSYYELNEVDIDLLIPKEHRHATFCDHVIAPLVISNIAKRIFSDPSVRRQVARLQCTFRRIARSALWLLLEERNASDPIRILAMQTKFQEFVNNRFDEYLNRIYERSSRWISKAAGHIMDAQIVDRQLFVKKMLLQDTFKDLYIDWPLIPNEQQCIQLIAHHSDLQRHALQPFYDLIRQEAKLHYSDRILILAQMITATHTMEWEDISTAVSLKELRQLLKLNVGEQLLVQRFNLDKGFLSATELASEKKKLLTAIHEGVLNIRNKLTKALGALKRFDPYQPKFSNSSSGWVPTVSNAPKFDVKQVNETHVHHEVGHVQKLGFVAMEES